jgi:pilus assembly protein Flp/PilA
MGWLRNDRGASAAEYALILAVIGGAIALAAIGLGVSISASMNTASGEIRNCNGGC